MATSSEYLAQKRRFHYNDHHRLEGGVDEIFVTLLDDVYARLTDPQLKGAQATRALEELFQALRSRRLQSAETEWHGLVSACRRHPLKHLVHQDPFTYRSFSKPRGYSGDAGLLDFMYGREDQWPPPKASPIGRRVFDYLTLGPTADAVRARRAFIAYVIDRVADETCEPHVLSMGAGHLREASLAAAVKGKKLGRYVAMDGDPVSLKEVKRCYSCFGVETLTMRIRELLRNRLELGQFDLIYATGLFDYLRQSTTRRLARSMFQMLRPGGRLLVSNFLPGIRDVGYMEAFMDWHLIYRTRQEMIDMTMEIPQPMIRDITLVAEENDNILFLEATKKAGAAVKRQVPEPKGLTRGQLRIAAGSTVAASFPGHRSFDRRDA